MAVKVGMVSLGCSKNQVDAEIMLSLIQEAGFVLSADAGVCDVVIVNTCGFIEDAKRESIDNILEFCELKKEGKVRVVVITGCLAERYRQEMEKEIPEADVILGIGSNQRIVEAIKTALAGDRVFDYGNKQDMLMNGNRVISNLPFFAYLKVADGCDNRCSYCAIPLIRGSFRSRTIEDVVAEARVLAERGVKELNVVAQDTTRYGEDIYGTLMLPKLLNELCKIDGLVWIRLLYCYPERVTDELLDVMASEPKIVHYMDLPIQHVNGRILSLMNRRGDKESLSQLLAKIRTKMPDIALRTTLIVGFPTETGDEFAQLCQFVKEEKFDRLGCFAYSPEEDTPAYVMEGQVEDEIKAHRADIVMETQYMVMDQKNQAMKGSELTVLVEGYDRYADSYFGRSYMDAPDIDAKIFFTSAVPLKSGSFVTVRVEETLEYDLVGIVV